MTGLTDAEIFAIFDSAYRKHDGDVEAIAKELDINEPLVHAAINRFYESKLRTIPVITETRSELS